LLKIQLPEPSSLPTRFPVSRRLEIFFTRKKPARNNVALRRKEVRLMTRYPMPIGMGMKAVGMQNYG